MRKFHLLAPYSAEQFEEYIKERQLLLNEKKNLLKILIVVLVVVLAGSIWFLLIMFIYFSLLVTRPFLEIALVVRSGNRQVNDRACKQN
jgi:flagellar basal body-associated protein FliL